MARRRLTGQGQRGGRRRPPFALVAGCVLLAVGVMAGYVVPAWANGRALVLPLDDVYIHFQYAVAVARGTPYVYNPGLPPSSGATSLIYPYLLAAGRLAGLTGLALGWWALSLGAASLAGSCYVLASLARRAGLGLWAAASLTGVYALTGPVGWHYASGMETGLLILLMFATLDALVGRRFWWGVAAASLMAVTRPEGAILAVIASGGFVLTWARERRLAALWGGLPVAALGVQPLVNWAVTGSPTAAGSSAKSILSMVPADVSVIFPRIVGNFGRMWWELLTGYSPREGLYLPVGLLLLAAVGLLLLWRGRRPVVVLVAVGWLLAGTAAVSTLDPAFWHFKRYQMPFMALLFPLAGWALAAMGRRVRWGALAVLAATAAVSSTVYFAPAYRLNVGYLKAQQVPMAYWLRDNAPPDAVVAVHDVGLMRYLGERTTVDMVGLTTAGAADSWRNGPGALAEFLSEYEPRPGYVASYTDALGLSYLADTGLYGELLAEFPVELNERYNVALAGAYQGVWRIDWTDETAASEIGFRYYREYVSGARLVDTVDVASLTSEAAHGYTWHNDTYLLGFPTEVYTFNYPDGTAVLDGGRLLNGESRFFVDTVPGEDMVLVTRVHPKTAGTFTVYANSEPVATRTIPAIPGGWIDVATRIDSERITGAQTALRLVADVPGGHYMPYRHWVYQGDFPQSPDLGRALATYLEGAFGLLDASLEVAPGQLTTRLLWGMGEQQIPGDYRLFVHVYSDFAAPPLAQSDRYPVNGALPPGNWLTGELSDTIMVDLQALSPGRYTVALGLYDPATGERLMPTAQTATDDRRLIIGEIEVYEDG